MASYYGSEILFDGVSSLNFDLRISSIESGGNTSGDAGSTSTIVEKRIYRRPSSYYYGRLLNTPLELKISLTNFDKNFTALDRSVVESWLLGRSSYKELMIVQDDMSSIIFNAFIDKATIKYVGNVAVGIDLDVKCKEPWGFDSEKTLTKTYADGTSVNETFNFYNDSSHDDYLYPVISYVMGSSPTVNFAMRNLSDSSRPMQISYSYPNLSVGIDCDKQIITNNEGFNLMSKFNKKFFRLVPKMNQIQIMGSIVSFSMTYQFARKVGG